jgi:hypothetical protein
LSLGPLQPAQATANDSAPTRVIHRIPAGIVSTSC